MEALLWIEMMKMLDYEKGYYSLSCQYIAGTDEAGRGPLAGPVCAAACIMPSDFVNEDINDSKQLTDKERRELYDVIVKSALAYSIVLIDADTMNRINIYAASKMAMIEALKALNHQVDMVLTDAMPLVFGNVKVEPIIKGDTKSINIACASILAKVTRDDYMVELDAKYPNYGFAKHKGYGTKEHLQALDKYGPIPHIHRYTYAPVKKLLVKQLNLI